MAQQAPLCMEFTRQEYCSGLPFPSPGDLSNPGIKPRSPTLQADSVPSEPRCPPFLESTSEVPVFWRQVLGAWRFLLAIKDDLKFWTSAWPAKGGCTSHTAQGCAQTASLQLSLDASSAAAISRLTPKH